MAIKKQSLAIEELNNKFLKDWIQYTDGRESPFIFNLWSGISAVAACLGRRNTFTVGGQQFIGNMYVVLIGPPAVRKSSAGAITKKLITKYTNVVFGPTDTGGKKQGLLSAYMHKFKDEAEEAAKEQITSVGDQIFGDEKIEAKPATNGFANAFATSAKYKDKKAKSKKNKVREMFVFADEFSTFIGLNQKEMTDCISELYYPQDFYDYSLSKEVRLITKPSLSFLGCTTPTSLASNLPPSCIGQGLSSRMIFVYQAIPNPKVYPVPEFDKKLERKIGNVLADICSWEIDFKVDDGVVELIAQIYTTYKSNINDTRFEHYEMRRNEHLHKLAMVLAAGDQRQEVTRLDVMDAHRILQETEKTMPDALGEIGLDKLALAKQAMKETIENSWPMGVSLQQLKANMLREMQPRDFDIILADFENRGICVSTTIKKSVDGRDIEVPIVMPAIPKEKTHKKTTSAELLEQFDGLLEDKGSLQ